MKKDEVVTINLDNPTVFDAMNSITCMTSYCRIIMKEINKETYPAQDEFENKQKLISYADSAREFFEWINQHIERTRF